MKKTFSSFTLLKEAWGLFQAHKSFFLKNVLVFGLISVVANSLVNKQDMHIVDFVLSITSSVSSWYGMVVLIRASLWLTSGKEVSDEVYTLPYSLIFSLIVGSILVGVGAFIGFIFVIVPGVIFVIRTYFTQYVILDTGLGGYVSLKKSIALTKGYFWSIVRLVLCILVLAFLSIFPLFGLGFIVLLPVMTLANAQAYRILSREQQGFGVVSTEGVSA